MTEYGWDASNHDWPRGKMDLARAKREGIELFTHKSTEGSTFVDPFFDDAMSRAKSVGFAVLGGYHVLWPNNPASQADFWFNTVNRIAPWWNSHPCWVWQIDAELFQEFNPYRAPTVAEVNACGDRIVARSKCKPSQVAVYAPKWLYGDQLKGLKYRNLWASAYVNGSGSPQHLYPGDKAGIWNAYSGIAPTIGQFTSSATIAGQAPADANAIRVSSPAALQALFLGGQSKQEDITLDATTKTYLDRMHADINKHVDDRLKQFVPRAVLMVLTGQTNALYNASSMDGAGAEKGTLDDFSGFKANPFGKVLAAQTAAITALAEKTNLTPDQIKAIITEALAASVVDVNVTVHGDTGATP